MITWRNATVSGTRREWPGAVELDVSVDGAPAEGGPVRALAYPALTGRPRPGDRVLVNTTALDLGLGTGGYALVIAVPDRLPPDPELAGHLVKARYSPLQATVLAARSVDGAAVGGCDVQRVRVLAHHQFTGRLVDAPATLRAAFGR